MGLFGRLLFWPSLERLSDTPVARTRAARTEFYGALTRMALSRPVAFVVMLICLGLLALAARGLAEVNLGITAIRGLPGESEERRAAVAAGEGFAPGVLAPLTVLVEGDEELPREGLERLETRWRNRKASPASSGPGTKWPAVFPSSSPRRGLRRFATW